MVRGGSGPCADQCTTQLWEPCRWPRMTEISYCLSHSQGHHSHSRLPMAIGGHSPSAELTRSPVDCVRALVPFVPHAEMELPLLSTSHNTMASASLESCPHLLLPDPALDGQLQCSSTMDHQSSPGSEQRRGHLPWGILPRFSSQ